MPVDTVQPVGLDDIEFEIVLPVLVDQYITPTPSEIDQAETDIEAIPNGIPLNIVLIRGRGAEGRLLVIQGLQ